MSETIKDAGSAVDRLAPTGFPQQSCSCVRCARACGSVVRRIRPGRPWRRRRRDPAARGRPCARPPRRARAVHASPALAPRRFQSQHRARRRRRGRCALAVTSLRARRPVACVRACRLCLHAASRAPRAACASWRARARALDPQHRRAPALATRKSLGRSRPLIAAQAPRVVAQRTLAARSRSIRVAAPSEPRALVCLDLPFLPAFTPRNGFVMSSSDPTSKARSGPQKASEEAQSPVTLMLVIGGLLFVVILAGICGR